MKNSISFIFFILVLTFCCCKKEYIPVLSTSDVKYISWASAFTGGNILDGGSSEVIRRGVCWSILNDPTINDNKTTDGSGTGEYTSRITGLSGNTKYYLRAYASNIYGTGYGNEISFSTLPSTLPEISTKDPIVRFDDGVYDNFIITGGDIFSDGGMEVISRGVCWSTSNQSPSISDNKTSDGSGDGSYLSRITGFQPGTTYYIRAYATNGIGTNYGNTLKITTPCYLNMMRYTFLSLSSPGNKAFGLTLNTTLNWQCNGAGPMSYDVYFDTVPVPVKKIATSITTNSLALTGLDSATTYYWKIYAYNPKLLCDTFTSTIYSFTTIGKPEVKTLNVSKYTFNTAIAGGEIIKEGGAPVTDFGIFWGTASNPELTGIKLPLGNGTGLFSYNLTNLTPGTTYYVKAYATNKFGTSYGAQIEFKTDRDTYLPELVTSRVIEYTNTFAIIGGYVLSEGEYTVTDRGIYWGTSENPEISGARIQIGSGTGMYSYTLTGLNPGTTYYLKAYAINQEGPAYGSLVTFNSGYSSSVPSVSDYEGNVYHIVQIGNQTWMAENLKSTKYADGTPITLVNTVSSWNELQDPHKAYCWLNDDPENKNIYGALYTWAAAMNGATSSDKSPSSVKGVCPVGWHLPSLAEWDQLRIFLGGENMAGGKMKEPGTLHWLEPNKGATNESGFTALPGGERPPFGTFATGSTNIAAGNSGYWWSSNQASSGTPWNHAWSVKVDKYNTDLSNSESARTSGVSVRCVKD